MNKTEELVLKITELIESARASGLAIEGHSACCGCSSQIFIDVIDPATDEYVSVPVSTP